MRILVINGSPKGNYSITLQTCLYLERLYPEHNFEYLHAGQKIRALEKDFSPALDAFARAELVIFAYPVYSFLAPSQLHRFIALMKERGADVRGKFASQITTSKRFYDVTAHRYVQDNCQEMGMHCLRGLSADMEDLLGERGRAEASDFFRQLLWSMEQGYTEPTQYSAAAGRHVPASVPADCGGEKGGNVVIVADLAPEDHALAAMIERFRARLPRASRLVNLREFPFKGGCLGCFHCAADGKCVHKDGFDSFLREEIQASDAMVFAFSIRDHSMGPLFKQYDDRQFCNGHRTVTEGMPVGYIVSGALPAEENLRTVIEARAQVGGNILAGVACDEEDTDGAIDRLAASLVYALENKPLPAKNFYGVGGMKIFRDLIYQMRGMMKADHRFFKAHGKYDFPQKRRMESLKMYLVGMMIASPKIRAKMGNAMNEGMLAPYKKLLDGIGKK